MTTIRLFAHPLAGAEQRFQAESIGAWLLQHYGAAPEVGVQIFAGEPSEETEVTGDVEAILRNDAPEYVVLQSPGTDPILWIQIILAVISVASALSAQSASMPQNVNRTQQSPNNALGARENQLRIGERVEDIFGTVRSVPSLMMPPYYKYIDHRKFEYGYYCISRGYIDAEDVSDGDSLLSDISGSSAAVYWPFTSPNSGAPVLQIGTPIIDGILTVARSNEVDGITLKALNQLQLAPGADYKFERVGGIDRIVQDKKAPNVNSLFEPGDQITVAMSAIVITGTGMATADSGTKTFTITGLDPSTDPDPFGDIMVGDSVTVYCAAPTSNNAVFTVTALASLSGGVTRKMTVAETVVTVASAASTDFTVSRDYSGVYDIAGVGDGFLEVSGANFSDTTEAPATITIVGPAPTEWTDWVTLRAPGRSEVWLNIVAPNGLVKDDGGQSACTVEFEAEIEKLNPGTLAPLGIVETVASSLSGSVTEERADTVEHATSWTGPARVRMRRTSDHDFDFKGSVIDEIKWQDLYSVAPVDQPDFGNKSTIHTITEATARSTAVKTRQLNLLASRLIPTYDGSAFSGAFNAAGRHVSGTIHATSRIVDIMAAVSVDPQIGGRNLALEVDMAQLYTVQQQLDAVNAQMGQFNYTFDSDAMSFEETLAAIANAGFCTAYRQNGKIRIRPDIAQPSSVALFTHRNKAPRSETITRGFAADGGFDGVEFLYTDPDTEKTETITLPLDGNYTKLKKFEIPGIRNFTQAWLRANREYSKLVGQRVNIETKTTMDARALLPGARVDIVDNTRFATFDGEVIGQSGLTLTLSQPVQITGGAWSIILVRRDGSLESMPVAQGASPRQVVIRRPPGEAIVTTPGPDGIRTMYFIGPDSAKEAQAYLIGEIDLSDGQYAVIRGANYSASFYEKDKLPIPDKYSVIN